MRRERGEREKGEGPGSGSGNGMVVQERGKERQRESQTQTHSGTKGCGTRVRWMHGERATLSGKAEDGGHKQGRGYNEACAG